MDDGTEDLERLLPRSEVLFFLDQILVATYSNLQPISHIVPQTECVVTSFAFHLPLL